jgi:hypothetical protein
MKWGGRGVGTERSEGRVEKDTEGSEISTPLHSLSSVRMNANSECACFCLCLFKLGVQVNRDISYIPLSLPLSVVAYRETGLK